jgi:uncharacterized protein
MEVPRLLEVKVDEQFVWNTVVLQPTTLCNLDCSYCYLPDRLKNNRMPPAVAKAVASVLAVGSEKRLVLWHGGEPLATGIRHFERLVEEFEWPRSLGLCEHSLQTNATLIDGEWCDFLLRYRFQVGVSIDGPRSQNVARKGWSGQPAFESALRGIASLRDAGIKFGIIAVVNRANLDSPEELYDFLCSLGPCSISVNVEEREGNNIYAVPPDRRKVDLFWDRLLAAWVANPRVPIRQFRDAFNVIDSVATGKTTYLDPSRNIYPTVTAEGDVFLLSPELAALPLEMRPRFVVGNVLRTSLSTIVEEGLRSDYVNEFIEGVVRCRSECEYFPFCRGGQASNKQFENGTLNSTETEYCRSSRIGPAKAVLASLDASGSY